MHALYVDYYNTHGEFEPFRDAWGDERANASDLPPTPSPQQLAQLTEELARTLAARRKPHWWSKSHPDTSGVGPVWSTNGPRSMRGWPIIGMEGYFVTEHGKIAGVWADADNLVWGIRYSDIEILGSGPHLARAMQYMLSHP